MPDASIRAVDEVRLPQPPEPVFAVLRDVAGYRRWWPWTVFVRVLQDAGGVGTEVQMRPMGGPPVRFRLTEIDPPRRIRMLYHTGPVQGWAEWVVIPEGEGSRVQFRLEGEGRGWLVRTAARLLPLAVLHSYQMRDVLRRLKEELQRNGKRGT